MKNISKEDYVIWNVKEDRPVETYDIVYHYTTIIEMINSDKQFKLSDDEEIVSVASLKLSEQRKYSETLEEYKDQVPTTMGLDCIIDECELHDENDEFFNIFLKELSDPIQFIAEGMSTGRIIKFNLIKTPTQLTVDERHRVLEYNLGKNFPMNEAVTLRDIFMQDEFIERIN